MERPLEIRPLATPELRDHVDALATVLFDCVDGGASVSYLDPFTVADARAAFEGFVVEAEAGRRVVLAAFADGELVGTVQLILALPPNQPHRGEIAKLLVSRSAPTPGVASSGGFPSLDSRRRQTWGPAPGAGAPGLTVAAALGARPPQRAMRSARTTPRATRGATGEGRLAPTPTPPSGDARQ